MFDGNGQRCFLVVDDDPLMLETICSAVHRVDPSARIVRAGGLAAAYEVLASERCIDVVLLDNQLPDGYGIDAMATFRQKLGPDARMALCTTGGFGMSDALIQGKGGDLLITKPLVSPLENITYGVMRLLRLTK